MTPAIPQFVPGLTSEDAFDVWVKVKDFLSRRKAILLAAEFGYDRGRVKSDRHLAIRLEQFADGQIGIESFEFGTTGRVTRRLIESEPRSYCRESFICFLKREGGNEETNAYLVELLIDAVAPPTTPHPTFHLLPQCLAWNDRTVEKVARTIYEKKGWGELPILADALEESGLEDTEILNHFRSGCRHSRACWALSLVLGKEPVQQDKICTCMVCDRNEKESADQKNICVDCRKDGCVRTRRDGYRQLGVYDG